MSVRTTLLMSAALLLGGCSVSSELGKECTLVRKATPEEEQIHRQGFMPILQKEVAPDQDFISFGSLECEDLICVRDAAMPVDPNPEGHAKGYCSKECVEGASACEVTASDAVEGVAERMGCRALLLDQATLEALRSSDEAFYRRTFGENNSPFFCAAGPVAQQGN